MNRPGRIVHLIKAKLRRLFLTIFRTEYVARQLEIRRGTCLQCGKCCNFLFRCPFLWGRGDNVRCLIYHLCRPLQCLVFPIDEKDLQDIEGPCGYSFPAGEIPRARRGRSLRTASLDLR